MERNSLFFISIFLGDMILSYMEVYAFFCSRIDFTNFFVMSLDFADIKNIENMSVGMICRMH